MNPSTNNIIYSTKTKSRLITQEKNSKLKIISKTISKYLKFNSKTCLPVIPTYPILNNILEPKLKDPFLIISLNNNPFINKYYPSTLPENLKNSNKNDILINDPHYFNYINFILFNLKDFDQCEFIG